MSVATRGILKGNETEAFGTANMESPYRFRYLVVDLDDLVPSHTDDLQPNARYPQELQPRLRSRAASRTQVENIARTLNPRALLQDSGFIDTGPMIVGPDMVVESGNGRVLALRKAREDFPSNYERYKKMLETVSPQFGIDRAQITTMKEPVLVRERLSNVDRAHFAAEANVGATMGMSPYEQALQDAKGLSPEIVGTIAVGEDQTIDQALRMRANDDIVKHFVGNVPANERAAIADEKGNINQQGLDRLKLALFARTYTGESGQRLTRIFGESADPYVKTIENAMFASLPEMAKAESLIDSGQREKSLTIAPDMAEVVDTYASLKASGLSTKDYLAQHAMFEDRLDPFQKQLLEHLDDIGRKPKLVREMIREISDRIIQSPPKGQTSMMGLPAASKEELVYGVINKQRSDLGKAPIAAPASAARSPQLEESKPRGSEGSERMAGKVGSGLGPLAGSNPQPVMAAHTSVQVGLAGMGRETAQTKMLEEHGTAAGQGGTKLPLIDAEAIKEAESRKPLPGQIDMLTRQPVGIEAALEPKPAKAKKTKATKTTRILPTKGELIIAEAGRSRRAQLSDERQNHSTIIKPTDARVIRWKKNPGDMDVQGIDTAPTINTRRSKYGISIVRTKAKNDRLPRFKAHTPGSPGRDMGDGTVITHGRRHVRLD